jgi:DNA-binding NtrC family response regulator
MRILVVEDEPTIRFSLVELLEADGAAVRAVENAPAALAMLEAEPADLIISDLKMPAMDGLQFLEEVRQRHPASAFVLMTAHGDERVAVRALKAGAWDYLPKPYDNEEVRALVRRVRETLALRSENVRLREELSTGFGEMIGEASAMREVWRVIRRAAPTDATVLIAGESGTGKELAARAVHAASRRTAGPFVALNCSALPAELIESEMFGHVRGAFTGAERDREGLFHAARGGTLFLDEVGDLAPAAQPRLLRVLEQRTITRVGSTREEEVDARIIAATNQPLDTLVAEGGFREDLLYRLRVITLSMPPLRERRGDIIPLAVHFIAEFGKRHGWPVTGLTEAARRSLLAHDWPGNVRELRNAIERAVVLVEGDTVDAADLPVSLRATSAPLAPAEAVIADLPFTEARDRASQAFERAFLSAALERYGGNVSATARAIGLHRQSLQKMMRRLGLQDASGGD